MRRSAEVLSQFRASGSITCLHGRHIEPQILAGLDGINWRLADYEARGGYQALRKIDHLRLARGVFDRRAYASLDTSRPTERDRARKLFHASFRRLA